jgi:hypothetical protein
MKNIIFALSFFAFTVPGFAKENSKSEPSSSSEVSAHQHGGSVHGSHGSHGHQGGHGGHGGGHGHGHGRSHDHRNARGHYHNGRFDHGYYNSHFGPAFPIFWGGAGFWFGAPWVSPFWFGGVYWGWGPGVVFLPEWQVGGWYVASISTGYVLLNPAFSSVQVPVVVQINLAPPDDEDEADESDEG